MLYDKSACKAKDHPFQAWHIYIYIRFIVCYTDIFNLVLHSCKTITAIIQNLMFKAHITDVSVNGPEKGMFKFGEGMESP